MPGQRPPSAGPPGWYPDPWAPGGMRWWSGVDWTAYAAPGAVKQTDGWAIASLITSLSGLGPVGIVLGFIARRRISKDPDRRMGKGLATSGIAVGVVGTALVGLFFALWAGGVLEGRNADDYSGTEREIARTIDRFEDEWDDDNGTTICNELFTRDLAASYQGDCASEWDDGFWVDMDVESIDVYGDTATVKANDSDVVDWTFEMSYVDGEWRICGLESH